MTGRGLDSRDGAYDAPRDLAVPPCSQHFDIRVITRPLKLCFERASIGFQSFVRRGHTGIDFARGMTNDFMHVHVQVGREGTVFLDARRDFRSRSKLFGAGLRAFT